MAAELREALSPARSSQSIHAASVACHAGAGVRDGLFGWTKRRALRKSVASVGRREYWKPPRLSRRARRRRVQHVGLLPLRRRAVCLPPARRRGRRPLRSWRRSEVAESIACTSTTASTGPNNLESSFVRSADPGTQLKPLSWRSRTSPSPTHKLCSKKHGYSLSPLTLPYLLTLLFSLSHLFVRVVRLPRIRWPTPANTASAPTTTGRA